MEYQKNILILVVVLLVALAVYLTVQGMPGTNSDNDSQAQLSEVESLLIKGISFGQSVDNYVYSYTRVSDGYFSTYALIKNGNKSKIEVSTPLSYKEVYFLENDTIMCVDYRSGSVCASVHGNAELKNYLDSLKAEFFNDVRINRNLEDMNYLISNNYVILGPVIEQSMVNGHACNRIRYVLDYNNITVSEAARFGVGTSTPKLFMRSMCIDESNEYRYEETLNYSYEGRVHEYSSQLVEFKSAAEEILPPSELEDASVLISKFHAERTQQAKLAECYTTKEGDALNICISNIALDLHDTDLCEYANGRRDRCLVAIVPLTKNELICPMINDLSYKDDCYIELAGAYKNSTYCDNIQNSSKVEFCMNVSVSSTPSNTSPQNVLGTDPTDIVINEIPDNSSGSYVDYIIDRMIGSENDSENMTNTTNEST